MFQVIRILSSDKLTLVVWKKSNKLVPTLEKAYDTPIQIAAYVGAMNYDPSIPFAVRYSNFILRLSQHHCI